MDRDGLVLANDDGTPQTDAQPPFLLRYSPQLFAEEAPEIFAYDPNTNRLSLKEGKREPWKRDMTRAKNDKHKTWLYCTDCHSHHFATGRRVFGHIPFRDRASQSSMRRPADKEVVDTQEDEPEVEPAANDTPPVDEEQEPVLPLHETLCEEMEEEHDDDDIADPLAEEEAPDPLDKVWPTLDEYKAKWDRLKDYHSRTNPGGFSRHNLVPEPIPQLWQDCPYVPFSELKSDDAMSRLSRCRPVSGFQPSHCEDGIIRFAHNTGEVNFHRRGPMQLASTLGFILNKRSGKFLKLTPREQDALHECLTWLRQPGHNVHCFYGDELEAFDTCCRRLMKRIKTIIPEGCSRARIRATSRVTKKLEDGGTLADTLGDEARGMVVVDFDGHPTKYDDLKIMSDVVAKEVNILKVDVPRENGKGWKRTAVEIDAQDPSLGAGWRELAASGAKYIIQETWVKANDPHFDAKVWPGLHPHGTGSVLSEPRSGSLKGHARNRAGGIQSLFRRTAVWAFWMLDRQLLGMCVFTFFAPIAFSPAAFFRQQESSRMICST